MFLLIQRKVEWLYDIRQSRFQSKECYHGHFIMIKGSMHPEDITILNVFVPHYRALKIHKAKPTTLQGKGDKSTITVRDPNALL